MNLLVFIAHRVTCVVPFSLDSQLFKIGFVGVFLVGFYPLPILPLGKNITPYPLPGNFRVITE